MGQKILSFPRFYSVARICLCLGLLGGCVAKDGPSGDQIRGDAGVSLAPTADVLNYAFVSLSPPVVELSNRLTLASNPTFHGLGHNTRPADVRIAVGDILALTVFEAAAGGLFIPPEAGVRAGNFVNMPNEQVDSAGFISVPYAGNLKVAGKTADEVAAEITAKLKSRAIEPQVIVTINERRGLDISVLGEVGTPARFFLDPGGIKVLGAIARAGGSRFPVYESIVTIQRRGAKSQAVLSTIVKEPQQNVQLEPGDVVYVSREPKAYMVFGATHDVNNGKRLTFEDDNMTLAEGLAKAGGLADERADPRSVFLFRFETRAALQSLGVDTSAYHQDLIPTVYSIDLTKADGFFLMNDFYLRHKDMIVAADSPSIDVQKFLTIFNTATNSAYNIGLVAK